MIGVTLLTMLGVLPVGGLETIYAFVPPPVGTVVAVLLVAGTASVARAYLFGAYRRSSTHRRAAIGLSLSAALCVTAFNAVQHHWMQAQPIALLVEASVPPWGTVSNLLVGLVLAPMLEEFLFRGYMLSRLLTMVSAPTAVMLSAVTFAIIHMDTSRLLGQFLTGILLATIVVATSRLWLAILAHAFISGSSMLEDAAVQAGLPDAMGRLYVVMCAAIAVLAAWEFRRVLRTTAWKSFSNGYRNVSRPVTWDAEPLL